MLSNIPGLDRIDCNLDLRSKDDENIKYGLYCETISFAPTLFDTITGMPCPMASRVTRLKVSYHFEGTIMQSKDERILLISEYL